MRKFNSAFFTLAIFLAFEKGIANETSQDTLLNQESTHCQDTLHILENTQIQDAKQIQESRQSQKNSVRCQQHWKFVQEFLYWKAHEGRLQYTNQPSTIATTTNFDTTALISPHFEWDLGVRETLIFYSSPDSWICDWNFAGEWTYIRNNAKGRLQADEGQGSAPVLSLLQDTNNSDFITDASFKWHVNLNVFEGQAIYIYQPFCWLYLPPYLGFRVTWIYQGTKIEYSGGSLIAGPESIHMHNHFFGMGPVIGIKPKFVLSKEWSLYSFFGFAPVFGRFDLLQEDDYTVNNFYDKKDHVWKIRPIIDTGAGIEWLHSFCKDRYSIGLKAGWEYHVFFSQDCLKDAPLNLTEGSRNLNFRGWTFSLEVGF